MDAFQSAWYRLVLLFFAGYLTVLWFVLGPDNPHVSGGSPAWPYEMSVIWGTCSLVPALPTDRVMRRVPRQWFRVPTGERVFHRILGVGSFGWLLDVSGWNHLIQPLRGFSGKRPAYYPWNSPGEPVRSRTGSASLSTYYWPS